jgi:hypothetical protein
MSRYYGMQITIEGYVTTRREEIINAASAEWSFGDWNVENEALGAYGQDNLCGGETEEEFTDRIAAAVWKANEGYCRVEVRATYLEDLPHDNHERGEDDYARWQAEKHKPPSEGEEPEVTRSP